MDDGVRYEVLDERPGTIVFRTHRAGYGIWIRLGATATDSGEAELPLTGATGLVLLDRVAARSTAEEVAQLARGMRLALERAALAAPPALIAVEEIAFPETDFQPDGLAAAGYAWVARAFDAALPPIAVRFDGTAPEGRFRIEFPPA